MSTATLRHEATTDCNGEPMGYACTECEVILCSCEYGYGHDCEPFDWQYNKADNT